MTSVGDNRRYVILTRRGRNPCHGNGITPGGMVSRAIIPYGMATARRQPARISGAVVSQSGQLEALEAERLESTPPLSRAVSDDRPPWRWVPCRSTWTAANPRD